MLSSSSSPCATTCNLTVDNVVASMARVLGFRLWGVGLGLECLGFRVPGL